MTMCLPLLSGVLMLVALVGFTIGKVSEKSAQAVVVGGYLVQILVALVCLSLGGRGDYDLPFTVSVGTVALERMLVCAVALWRTDYLYDALSLGGLSVIVADASVQMQWGRRSLSEVEPRLLWLQAVFGVTLITVHKLARVVQVTRAERAVASDKAVYDHLWRQIVRSSPVEIAEINDVSEEWHLRTHKLPVQLNRARDGGNTEPSATTISEGGTAPGAQQGGFVRMHSADESWRRGRPAGAGDSMSSRAGAAKASTYHG
eukprot:CAMPEP_0169426178 /NCGR_PEP_ID=MMETSP1042-20121227/51_1 /TAXON_ID=464988 /ORGANISM="Hemiselmis andersenii, Strain CCMP1180" /LENGTH=259 /DNA_ID=CAMNT_0009536057 /DNA_START=39 /DNA_END=815 /DNA_ORIENTATION=-